MYPLSMFLSKNKKTILKKKNNNNNFYNLRKICILHGRFFVMSNNYAGMFHISVEAPLGRVSIVTTSNALGYGVHKP